MKTEQLKYVLRNILRKKKQTFFSFLCIGISSLIIFFNLAFNNGIQFQLKRGINEGISGNTTIYKSDKENINILESQLSNQKKFHFDENNKSKFFNSFGNLNIDKRIRFGALVSHNEETSYLNIQALEDDHFSRISSDIKIEQGSLPTSPSEILISHSFAKELKVSTGDTLLIVADNTNGYMSDAITTVKGIFKETGLAIYFDRIGFVKYKFGEDLVQIDNNEAVELIVNPDFKNNDDIDRKTYERIENYFSAQRSNFRLSPWNKTVPLLFSIVEVWNWGGKFTYLTFLTFSMIILVSVSTLVANSRKKEFGTLIAIGFKWKEIYKMILLEYLIIALSAIFIGLVILFTFLKFMIPQTGMHIGSVDLQAALLTEYIRPKLTLEDVLFVSVVFITIIIISIGITIQKIKKYDPLKLINN